MRRVMRFCCCAGASVVAFGLDGCAHQPQKIQHILFRIIGLVLKQDKIRPQLPRALISRLAAIVGGDDHKRRRRQRHLLHSLQHLQPVAAAKVQLQIQNEHTGERIAKICQRLGGVVGHPHQRKIVRCFDQPFKPLACRGIVLYQHNRCSFAHNGKTSSRGLPPLCFV